MHNLIQGWSTALGTMFSYCSFLYLGNHSMHVLHSYTRKIACIWPKLLKFGRAKIHMRAQHPISQAPLLDSIFLRTWTWPKKKRRGSQNSFMDTEDVAHHAHVFVSHYRSHHVVHSYWTFSRLSRHSGFKYSQFYSLNSSSCTPSVPLENMWNTREMTKLLLTVSFTLITWSMTLVLHPNSTTCTVQ